MRMRGKEERRNKKRRDKREENVRKNKGYFL